MRTNLPFDQIVRMAVPDPERKSNVSAISLNTAPNAADLACQVQKFVFTQPGPT